MVKHLLNFENVIELGAPVLQMEEYRQASRGFHAWSGCPKKKVILTSLHNILLVVNGKSVTYVPGPSQS